MAMPLAKNILEPPDDPQINSARSSSKSSGSKVEKVSKIKKIKQKFSDQGGRVVFWAQVLSNTRLLNLLLGLNICYTFLDL
jgi:hypothetical protein